MGLSRDHGYSLIAVHAARALLIATTVAGIAALWGFAVTDLHELASHWVLHA